MTILIYKKMFFGPFKNKLEAVEVAESWGWDFAECSFENLQSLEKQEE